jgi:hypothetical protein
VRGFHPDVRLLDCGHRRSTRYVGLMLSSLYIRRALDLNLFPAVRLDRAPSPKISDQGSGVISHKNGGQAA